MPILDLLRVMLSQSLGHQRLERTPEPSDVTDALDNVLEYDRVLTTKLALTYAAGLLMLHRARPAARGGEALDLASGPGHFTLHIARHLALDSILGVDLSAPMVEVSSRNAESLQLADIARFQVGDVTRLQSLDSDSRDLSTFTNAAHHLPDLDTVTGVLTEMDRITRPQGLVMMMDVARLRTSGATERYVNALAHDYVERGLPHFLDDFRNSMYAAFTARELRTAVPGGSARRTWWQVVPRWIPSMQVVLGLPTDRARPFVRGGFPWEKGQTPLPPEMLGEWRMLRLTLRLGSRRLLA